MGFNFHKTKNIYRVWPDDDTTYSEVFRSYEALHGYVVDKWENWLDANPLLPWDKITKLHKGFNDNID